MALGGLLVHIIENRFFLDPLMYSVLDIAI